MAETPPFVILVVDDEPPICDLLTVSGRKTFPEASFINTRSARETMTYLNDPTMPMPQLILLDIDLHQEIDGLALLPRLRTRLNGQIPIIIFSSATEQANVKMAYSEGAVSFTQKPEDLQSWRAYVGMLREYWYKTSLLPSDVSTPHGGQTMF